MDKDDLFKLLEIGLKIVERTEQKKVAVNKWCITIWAGLVLGILSQKIQLTNNDIFIILISPIVMFWMLEGMYGAILEQRNLYVHKLENLIKYEKYNNCKSSN